MFIARVSKQDFKTSDLTLAHGELHLHIIVTIDACVAKYEFCPEGIQPCNMTESFIEEDTRHKKRCTQDNDASVPFKVGTLGPLTVLIIVVSCPIVFF